VKIEDQFNKWVDKYDKFSKSNELILDRDLDSKGTYVDLTKNPEAFTGYQGQHIWNAIFRENCFSDYLDQICTEELVFYKIFSGLLANINMHISTSYFDSVTNQTYVNLTMMQNRLLDYPDRIENLFFLYSLMVKAFNKAEYLIRNFDLNTGNTIEDNISRTLLDDLFDSEKLKHLYEIASVYDEELDKFLNFNNLDTLMTRFRNVSSIIECVSCQKCKLHGKLQLYGISAMLKILLDKNFSNKSFKNMNLSLQRNELIAFINFFGKISRAVHYLRLFNDNIKMNNNKLRFRFIYIIATYFIVVWFVNTQIFGKKSEQQQEQVEKNTSKEKKD
jgi:ERO1-like protein alpha